MNIRRQTEAKKIKFKADLQIYEWKSRSINSKCRWRFQLTNDPEFEVVPSGVTTFIFHKYTPLADKSWFPSLNSSDLEQNTNTEC